MRLLVWLLLMALLAACTPGGGVPAPAEVRAPAAAKGPQPGQVDLAALTLQLEQLPGVEVQPQPLTFRYPQERLFGTGAVLPLPGGPPLLDPLARFLRQQPGLRWQVKVRARTDLGRAYDQALAEKRSALLARYLLSKGAELRQLDLQPAAEAGAPVEFILITTQTINP